MAPPRTLILSRSLYATLLLIAAVLTKLPVQPAGRLRPQLINSPPRQARKLTHSTLFLASRPIFLPSHPSTIMETQSLALVLTALAPPTLASAQHQRSSSRSALMTERRLLSRRLTRVRNKSMDPVQPAHAYDPVSYNHGSADNIGVITQFMCDALTNSCAANQAAKDLCTRAEAAANAATPLTGAQADGSCFQLLASLC